MTRSLRIGAIQPRSHTLAEEQRNLEDALRWLDRAAEAGAQLVVFPEGYPGPTNPINEYDSVGALAERAAKHGQYVVAGAIEPLPADREPAVHNVVLRLIGPAGQILAAYRRTTPHGPYIYRDIDAWQFDYRAADDPPRVVETPLGRIGMLVCSEVYVPELSRLLMLEGADLIVYPAGGAINELMDGWRTLLRARAIENLVYTVATQNLYAEGEVGVGTVAGPEGVLASDEGEGMLVADLDLDRLDYLRGEDERIVMPKPYRTIPGVLRWRRPELYDELTRQEEP